MVSVIIPAYNREAFVEECICSLQAQTYQDFEVIIVEDGSTDSTPAICRKLAEADSRIKLFQGDHQGVSAARNLALEHAVGKYVFFLDSDDIIHPDLLGSLVEGMEKTDAPMGATRCAFVRHKNWEQVYQRIKQSDQPGQTEKLPFMKALEEAIHRDCPLTQIGGVMIRRDWIGQTRFNTELFIGEDFYFVYENLVKGADTVFLKQNWYYARVHGNNTKARGYHGFKNRLLRRQLVWRNEEACGRQKFANKIKGDMVGVYRIALKEKDISKKDRKDITKLMKTYVRELAPALKLANKISFYMYLYLPFTQNLLGFVEKKLRKTKRKKKTV